MQGFIILSFWILNVSENINFSSAYGEKFQKLQKSSFYWSCGKLSIIRPPSAWCFSRPRFLSFILNLNVNKHKLYFLLHQNKSKIITFFLHIFEHNWPFLFLTVCVRKTICIPSQTWPALYSLILCHWGGSELQNLLQGSLG